VLSLLDGAARCDAIAKGLPQPGWPAGAWQALLQLAIRLSQSIAALRRRR
jgi:hypothetical protein